MVRPIFAHFKYMGTLMSQVLCKLWELQYWTEVHQIFTRCSGIIAAVNVCIGFDVPIHFEMPVQRVKYIFWQKN